MTEEGSASPTRSPRRRSSATRSATRPPTSTGFDAAAKAAIIAIDRVRRARRRRRRVPRGHHATITADDIARRGGARLRREAARGRRGARRRGRARACIRRWCRSSHPLASVRGSYNAVFIEGEAVGQLMLLGRGAGGGPTASAVLGDLIDAAKNLHSGARGATIGDARAQADPPDRRDVVAVLRVARRRRPARACSPRSPGVFGDHEVSIQSMQQKGQGDDARLIFVTHLAREAGGRGDDPRGARARRGQARRIGAARRRRRGMTELAHAGWPGIIEAYRDRLPGHRPHAGRHAATRATRRWSTRRGCRSRSARACC